MGAFKMISASKIVFKCNTVYMIRNGIIGKSNSVATFKNLFQSNVDEMAKSIFYSEMEKSHENYPSGNVL